MHISALVHCRCEECLLEEAHPDDLASSKLEGEGLATVAAAVKLHRALSSHKGA